VRGLKLLVIVMGVMIVAGFTMLIVTIAGRLSRGSPAAPFATGPIDIPRGARVEAMTAGTDRLVLGLELPDGARRLLILDLATGRELGRVELQTAP